MTISCRLRSIATGTIAVLGAAAVTVLGTAGAAEAQANMTGEFLRSFSPAELTSGTCDPSGSSTFTYSASGTATGPYAGTFSETGWFTIGPHGPSGGPLTGFGSQTEIDSPTGQVSVTSTLPALNAGAVASCLPAGPVSGAAAHVTPSSGLTYITTVRAPDGSRSRDQGQTWANFNAYASSPAGSPDLQYRRGFSGSAPLAGAPSVTAHPQSLTVAEGAPVSFSAAASGAHLQLWQMSTDNGVHWGPLDAESAYTYANGYDSESRPTNGTVSFTAVAGDHGQRFRVVYAGPVVTFDSYGDPIEADAITTNSATLTVTPVGPPALLAQTISFAPTNKTLADSPVTLTATASSGLVPVTFATASPLVCTTSGVNGATLTLLTAGQCFVNASQAGDSTYAPTAASGSFTVTAPIGPPALLAQTISFAPTNKTLTDSPVTLTATASSGLVPVTFATASTLVCTTSGVNGATLTLLTAGQCFVNASQAGDSTYAPTAASGSFTVTAPIGPPALLAQTISFAPTNKTLADSPVTLTATASSGLVPVTFATASPLVCTTSGVNGATLTLLTAGQCFVNASQAGDSTYAPTAASGSFTVTAPIGPPALLAQTISFAPTNKTLADSPVTLTATASSGLVPVTFVTASPLVCTTSGVNGATLTLLTAGQCFVNASQAGDSTYAPTAASGSFTVTAPVGPPALLAQTISFAAVPAANVSQTPLTMAATASSGLPVLYSTTTPLVCTAAGTQITLLRGGTCTVVASQPGNAVYGPAVAVSRSFAVTQRPRANQRITFPGIPTRTLAQSPFAVAPTASSGLPVTLTSQTPSVCTVTASTVALLAAGTCRLVATQPGSALYNAAPAVLRTFAVTKVGQVITFGPVPATPLSTGTILLSPTSSSGLQVTVISATPTRCSVSGTTVTLIRTGLCILVARQPGDGTFAAATPVGRGFVVEGPTA